MNGADATVLDSSFCTPPGLNSCSNARE